MSGGTARVAARYALFQVPGWLLAAAVAGVAEHFGLVPPWVAALAVALVVAKDAAMFPFVRRAYERDGKTHGHVGESAVAVEALDPEGWVRVGPELWRARIAAGAAPVAPGASVRVTAVDGLVLLVEPAPPA
jgi:membrane protein implicated in regulation of membrane protease activity